VLASTLALVSLVEARSVWPWVGKFGDDAVTLLIIGDVQVHERRPDPASAFVHLLDTLRDADLVYANLEGVLVESQGPDRDIPDKKGWTHPGPRGVEALKKANVRVVGVANNVAYGRRNIQRTIRLLRGNRIATVGGGGDIDEAHEPAIVEREGITIGFLQYTARWYRENEQIATERAAGVARISSRDGVTIEADDLERLRNDVRRLRPRADVVVVSHHNRDGGTAVQFGVAGEGSPRGAGEGSPRGAGAGEGSPRGTGADRTRAEDYQRQFARVAIDMGADLVFGHGTHTVQGVDLYKGKPILYAIGHSAFDQPGYENSKDGLVVRVVIVRGQIVHVSFVPVTRDARNNVMMIDPNGEGARLVEIVRGVSPPEAPLRIEGQEVVLVDRQGRPLSEK
jgi:poly-gamma-glutamate synthesis protein (capsule biosynthesis protein)